MINFSKAVLEWLEAVELEKVFEAIKSENPEATIHLGNLRDAEKAYREKRIDFGELSREKARLRNAALKIMGPKQ